MDGSVERTYLWSLDGTTPPVVVPKSSEGNISGASKANCATVWFINKLVWHVPASPNENLITERQIACSLRLKLAHRSAGYLRLSFEINQTKPAIDTSNWLGHSNWSPQAHQKKSTLGKKGYCTFVASTFKRSDFKPWDLTSWPKKSKTILTDT